MADDNPTRLPLRQRIKAAGGWYAWANASLIRVAGPASVGPYETTPPPTASERAERPCPLCGQAITAHTFDRSRDKPIMHCP
ncbi:hypothetical protein [Microbacterium sp. C7(2022)]|uniref:hypothetical protein n=1 Tax=Microbacterium sp. C7(2022) TaxID=2992759 RepID=UPI00237AA13D|nr:hypothetical protein [Microbacterium sp. C7(2022)]MDE0546796.1 hypothetical protein [Microbacterium sp. C7(2022)]